MIWISWPEKAAQIETDITGDIIRNIRLNNGFVDVKVCSVDETWSAIKLIVSLKDRRVVP
ncbi:hypothetical protein [Ferruginibacter sp.]|jgi:hypothetical protein|uniref:hypothetical protein n=1 Tax=Ferruginibacter sp. TaxID=1940288 RepID=UPI00265A21DA|nr:hypothetical protein [Ferruginibacter sp.]